MSNYYTYALMPSAVHDLEHIMDYLSNELCAKESAIALLDEIQSSIVKACRFPMAASAVNDALLRQKGYRKIVVKNYIVFYLVDDAKHQLDVMRVLYFAQDYLREL